MMLGNPKQSRTGFGFSAHDPRRRVLTQVQADFRRAAAYVFSLLALAACAHGESRDSRVVHERLLVLDTHLDTPAHFVRPGWSILERHDYAQDFSQVDYPRMVEGGLDGGFWVIYTPQGPRTPEATAAARAVAQERAGLIRALTEDHPDKFALALRADDAARIAASGRRVVFVSVENAYPFTGDAGALQAFYDLGVRMVGLAHFANNDFADSATDPNGPEWNGLSEAGRTLVREANRLGVVLDASHASDAVLDQLITLSATPVILSHSGPRGVYDHPRNVDDARLLRLTASGGVIQINAYGAYLERLPEPSTPRAEALAALNAVFGPFNALTSEGREEYQVRLAAINAAHPPPQSDFEVFIAHLLYALNLVGVDHVGIGADWDGGGGVAGLEDVAALPRITERLLAEGYSQNDIAKIWSGNVLRVLRAAEAHAAGEAR